MTLDEIRELIEVDARDREKREKAFDDWFEKAMIPKLKALDQVTANNVRTFSRAGFMAGATWRLDA